MRRSVRIRIALARRPWLVWLGVALVCVGAAAAMNAQLRAARSERTAWGQSQIVLVATAAVAPGTPLADAAVAARRLPLAAIPSSALDHAEVGAVVVRGLVAGEVLVPADVGAGDPRFALVPAGHVVVALPRPEVLAPIEAGDRVEVTTVDRDGRATRTRARVVAVTDEAVLVAVAPDDAAVVAAQTSDPSSPAGLVLVPDG